MKLFQVIANRKQKIRRPWNEAKNTVCTVEQSLNHSDCFRSLCAIWGVSKMRTPNVLFTALTCCCLSLCPPFCAFVYQLCLVTPPRLHLSAALSAESGFGGAPSFGSSLLTTLVHFWKCPFLPEICLPFIRSYFASACLLWVGSEACGSHQFAWLGGLGRVKGGLLCVCGLNYFSLCYSTRLLACLLVFLLHMILMFHVCTLCGQRNWVKDYK